MVLSESPLCCGIAFSPLKAKIKVKKKKFKNILNLKMNDRTRPCRSSGG
jgi:hypothetical protein